MRDAVNAARRAANAAAVPGDDLVRVVADKVASLAKSAPDFEALSDSKLSAASKFRSCLTHAPPEFVSGIAQVSICDCKSWRLLVISLNAHQQGAVVQCLRPMAQLLLARALPFL